MHSARYGKVTEKGSAEPVITNAIFLKRAKSIAGYWNGKMPKMQSRSDQTFKKLEV